MKIRTSGLPKNLDRRIGLKIKYTKNIPIILPHLKKLSDKLDYFEFGLRETEDYRDYKKLIKDSDLFVTLHGPLYEENVNLIVPQKNKVNLRNLKFCQEAADYFNAKYIVLHPGDRETPEASLENLYYLLDKVKDKRFILENTPIKIKNRPYERLGVYIKDFLGFKEKGIDMCFDFGHARVETEIERKKYYAYTSNFIKKVNPQYFHLSGNDGTYDYHWIIRDKRSLIDYSKILPFLPKNALLTLEIDFFDKSDGFDKEKVLKDIDYLRKLIN